MTADPSETPAGTAGAGTADLTLDAAVAAADVPPALIAQSLGQYVRASWLRVRGGDSGVLPVILGLVVVAVGFQIANSKFLSAQNLVNLFEQSTVYMLLAMAEIFALLLGEIDLSVGLVMGLGSVVVAELVQPSGAELAVVGGDHRDAARLRRGRRHPGNDGGPAEDAVVHRHSRRAADLGGRGDHRPRRVARRHWKLPVPQRTRPLRHLLGHVQPAGRLDLAGRADRCRRHGALAAGRSQTPPLPGGRAAQPYRDEDRPHSGRGKRARRHLQR